MQTDDEALKFDARDLATVATLVRDAPDVFSEGSVRWLIFHAKENGLDSAIVHVGRRVLIHRPTFNRWLATSPKISGRLRKEKGGENVRS